MVGPVTADHGIGLAKAPLIDPLDHAPLVLWDLRRRGTLWQDQAGTIPVTEFGQPIGRISDASGNGHHLILHNCTLVQDEGKAPRVYFDGLESWASTVEPIPFDGDEVQISAVIGKGRVTTTDGVLIEFGREGRAGSWRLRGPSKTAADAFEFECGGTETAAGAASGFASPGTYAVTALAKIADGELTVRVDGDEEFTDDELDLGTGDFGEHHVTIGASGQGTAHFAHLYLGTVVIYDARQSNEVTEDDETYLTQYSEPMAAGVPVLTSAPSVSAPNGYEIGESLVAEPASWTGFDDVLAFWTRNGKPIGIAATLSREMVDLDYGAELGYVELAFNEHGFVSASAPGGVLEPPEWLRLVGGEIVHDGDDVIHIFEDSAQIRVIKPSLVDYLVVAGGGGAHAYRSGITSGSHTWPNGGGGAGGVRDSSKEGEEKLWIAEDVDVTVGEGGLGGVGPSVSLPTSGQNSSIGDLIVALGGGRGGHSGPGGEGGSGGGGGGNDVNGTYPGGEGTPGQGFGGGYGNGSSSFQNSRRGGGGGGAGGPGVAGVTGDGGSAGGPGITSDITGEEKEYAGGGGGQNSAGGGTATHGGGSGQQQNVPTGGGDGTDGTGGGGGAPGGRGGKGIIIVRYGPDGHVDPGGEDTGGPGSEAQAIGGEVHVLDDYVVHIFKESDDFEVLVDELDVEYLVVGGGGSGGNCASKADGGGGGAGRVLTNVGDDPLTLEEGVYEITVGAGGVGVGSGSTSGDPSSISDLVVAEGGGGGGVAGTGKPGGSGGGGGGWTSGSGTFAGGAGISPGGNSGGNANRGSGSSCRSGSGGGAAEPGASSTSTVGAKGGDGLLSDITGSSEYYGGGGGGAAGNSTAPAGSGDGGLGGGGNAHTRGRVGSAGEPNTGGGGGGAGTRSGRVGLSGGSGIVVIRYPRTP